MFIKKLFSSCVIALATLTVGAALAGGPDQMQMVDNGPAAPAAVNQGIYVQGDIGYGFRKGHYKNVHNGDSFTAGGAVGYQLNRNFGAEFGYEDLVKHGPGLGFIAGRVMLPLGNSFAVFGKGGVADRFNGPGLHGHTVNPMFGAGAQYNLTQNWYVLAQWLHFMGNKTTTTNIAAAGLGYEFSI